MRKKNLSMKCWKTYDNVLETYNEYGNDLKNFLKQLMQPKTPEGETVQPFKWQFGIEEIQGNFW